MRRVEDSLRDALLLALPREIPGARGFYRNIIDRHVIDRHTRREYHLKSGSSGMADCFIFVPADPWPIEIEAELKAHDGRQSKEQIAWMNFCSQMKIPFLLLRQKKAETTQQTICRWIQEMKLLISSRRTIPSSSTPPLMQPLTAFPPARPTNSPTPETPSDSSNGSVQTFATFRSGTNGSRGIAHVGRNHRSARLRLPFKPPA